MRFDREAVFIDRIISGLVRDFPKLKIVFEHITTSNAADFVVGAPANVAATITPQHLIINRHAIFDGGTRPHARRTARSTGSRPSLRRTGRAN